MKLGHVLIAELTQEDSICETAKRETAAAQPLRGFAKQRACHHQPDALPAPVAA
jgi:hypothetical protein